MVRLSEAAPNANILNELRAYATRERNPWARGLAFLVLGSDEKEAHDGAAAERDFLASAATRFAFADIATYLAARAAYDASQPTQVISILADFEKRFPSSFERSRAQRLRASALIEAGKTSLALQALSALSPRDPSVLWLRAKAHDKLSELRRSAREDQAIYYEHPNSAEAAPASNALKTLRTELGVDFPVASLAAREGRAARLLHAGRFHDALAEYDRLLSTAPSGVEAWIWDFNRAHCLIGTRQPELAVETLVGVTPPTPALNAERMEILADGYANEDDEGDLLATLDEMRRTASRSTWYEATLSLAGYYFISRGEWDRARNCYHELSFRFPGGSLDQRARWRVAWLDAFGGNKTAAQHELTRFIIRYPRSDRVPAAIFYLAGIEKDKGKTDEALGLYRLLERLYVHDYYGLEAAESASALGREVALHPTAKAKLPNSTVASLTHILPSAPPLRFNPCARSLVPAEYQRALALIAVQLEPLARQVLSDQMARERPNDALRLRIARVEREAGQYAPALFSVKDLDPDYPDRRFSGLSSALWLDLYPQAHWEAILRLARANQLDPFLVMAVIRQESAFDPSAISYAGAVGLMQILPTTAGPWRDRYATKRRLMNPAYNLRFGCAYLREMIREFHGNFAEAVAAYNAGDVNVSRWVAKFSPADRNEFIQEIPYPATRWYVRDVLRDEMVYKQLMSGRIKFASCLHPPSRAPRSAHSKGRRIEVQR